MASVDKRLRDGRTSWVARWRDEAGQQRKKSFTKKGDADGFAATVEADKLRGTYVDPRAGKVTFKEYAEQWRAVQVHRPSSPAHVETMLRRHVYPVLGDLPLSGIVPSKVQAWVKGMTLAPSTVGVVHGIVAGIFRAAVRDRKIAYEPVRGDQAPP